MRRLNDHIARNLKLLLGGKYWTYLQSMRSRNHQLRWLKSQGLLDISKRFSELSGSSVLHGPFEGMKYPAASILSRHSVPTLLGSYELELHGIILEALRCQYQCVVDVGSAEGYYAVGFARNGVSPVVAFETDPRERNLCREMARLNEVQDRITIGSWCSPEALQAITAGARCFVLSDCEGYEIELFDPATVQALRRSDVVIEIHGDAYGALAERFEKTHVLRTFVAMQRSADDYPELAFLGENGAHGVSEHRQSGQRWLFGTPR